jgi:opacity protein-like surface antigen
MKIMRKLISAMLFLPLTTVIAQSTISSEPFYYPTYLGVLGGFGSTTWQGLVPSIANQNLALNISTPIAVSEGGGIWGFFAGYEASRYFAIEANYIFYPNAHITFDQDSLYTYNHDGLTSFDTHTDTASLMAKVMLVVPRTTVRAYSSFGIAGVRRKDKTYSDWRAAPTFGVGINYNFTQRIMGELGFNYTAGYGESELNPTNDYVPFLYSGFLKLAYRF